MVNWLHFCSGFQPTYTSITFSGDALIQDYEHKKNIGYGKSGSGNP